MSIFLSPVLPHNLLESNDIDFSSINIFEKLFCIETVQIKGLSIISKSWASASNIYLHLLIVNKSLNVKLPCAILQLGLTVSLNIGRD